MIVSIYMWFERFVLPLPQIAAGPAISHDVWIKGGSFNMYRVFCRGLILDPYTHRLTQKLCVQREKPFKRKRLPYKTLLAKSILVGFYSHID